MRWNYRSTQTKREYWLRMVGLAVKSFWEKKLHGTQRYSNLKNRAVAIDKLRREVELRGSQTPPWCSSRFRREIHGSQTYTQAKDIGRLIWKKIKLHGAQAEMWMQNVRSEDWKETKSQGSQTGHDAIHFARFERMQDFSILKAWRKVNYMVLKPDFFDVSMDFRFGKVWSCRVLKRQDEPQRCKKAKLQDTQTDIDFFTDPLKVWKKIKLHGTQTLQQYHLV